MPNEIILYHGSQDIVESPEIRIQRYNKDFYFGFYCTLYPEQAKRWATRFGGVGYLNEYCYVQNFVDGKISREAFWSLAKFKRPTHQISFHTAKALETLTFLKGSEVKDEE
jgi:hypothetical protein